MNSLKKLHIYFSTLFTYCGLLYIMGMLSMIKKSIASQFKFTESFLGILDGLFFTGLSIGSCLSALFPYKRPVYTAYLFCFAIILCLLIEILIKYVPTNLMPITFMVSRLILGIFLVTPIIALTIVSHYFSVDSDQKWIQIWCALGSLGQLFGILFSDFLLRIFNLSWQATVVLTCFLFALVAFYLKNSTPQIQMRNQQKSKQNHLQLLCDEIKGYYQIKLNFIQTLLFTLAVSLYYMMLMWLPYFFLVNGYDSQSAWISSSYTLAYALGTILLQPFQFFFRDKLGYVFLAMMISSAICSLIMCMIDNNTKHGLLYTFLIVLSTIFISGFSTYTLTTDLKKQVRDNHQYLIINSMNRLFVRLFEGISMVICGWLMQKDSAGFLKYYSILMIFCCIILIYRLVAYPKSYERNSEINQTQMKLIQ